MINSLSGPWCKEADPLVCASVCLDGKSYSSLVHSMPRPLCTRVDVRTSAPKFSTYRRATAEDRLLHRTTTPWCTEPR